MPWHLDDNTTKNIREYLPSKSMPLGLAGFCQPSNSLPCQPQVIDKVEILFIDFDVDNTVV